MSEQEPKPEAKPLDAEREKLRAAGYTDAEISQILITRAMGGGASHAASPGVMSNVIGSILAVAAYAGGLFTSFRADAATVFDSAAKTGARFSAALALTLKLVVIAVLGFAAWQEWQQHIISATRTAGNNSDLTDAQAKKAQAEAVYAEELAKGEKAKACAARLDFMGKNMSLGDIENGNIKPGSKLAQATAELNKDCDPGYAAHAKECAKQFDSVFNQFKHIDKKDNLAFDKIGLQLFKHRQSCELTDEQQQKLDTIKDELAASSERVKIMAGAALILRYQAEAKKEFDAGHYDAAYDFEKKSRDQAEEFDIKKNGRAGALTAEILVGVSWRALFARDYAGAVTASDRAVELNPPNVIVLTNKAHALMFLGRKDEAKALYLAHRGEKVDSKRTWEQGITGDFAEFRKAGLSDPLMSEIETALASLPEPDRQKLDSLMHRQAEAPVQAPPPVKEAAAEGADLPSLPRAARAATFNCAKATLGTDFVVCASPQLMDAETRLEDAYQAARAQRGDAVKLEQRAWIKRFGPDCGLPYRGRPDEDAITDAARCVGRAMEQRIQELQAQN